MFCTKHFEHLTIWPELPSYVLWKYLQVIKHYLIFDLWKTYLFIPALHCFNFYLHPICCLPRIRSNFGLLGTTLANFGLMAFFFSFLPLTHFIPDVAASALQFGFITKYSSFSCSNFVMVIHMSSTNFAMSSYLVLFVDVFWSSTLLARLTYFWSPGRLEKEPFQQTQNASEKSYLRISEASRTNLPGILVDRYSQDVPWETF